MRWCLSLLLAATACSETAGIQTTGKDADGEVQLALGYLLGTLRYSQLGQYGPGRFRDPRIELLVKSFQMRLDEIDRTIAETNRTRRQYSTLAASGILQSINV